MDIQSYQEWLREASRNASPLLDTPTELDLKKSDWLTQADIDAPAPPLGDGAGHGKWWRFWLWASKIGTWIACGILCFAFWYLCWQIIKLIGGW